MKEIQDQQGQIKAKIENLERENTSFIEEGLYLIKIGEQLAKKVSKFSFEEKRELLKSMLKDGLAAKDGKIRYEIQVPFDLFLYLRKGWRAWLSHFRTDDLVGFGTRLQAALAS